MGLATGNYAPQPNRRRTIAACMLCPEAYAQLSRPAPVTCMACPRTPCGDRLFQEHPRCVARALSMETLPFGAQKLRRRRALGKVIYGDNLQVLRSLEASSVDLIYVDPPFNTGKRQARTRIRTVRDDANGDRVGFQDRSYRTIKVSTSCFDDAFDDYLGFLEPRLAEACRVLKANGSFFLHVDYREVHYCKVLLDGVFGRGSFLNEIIWAYDFGARSRSRWSAKHDNILWYAKDPDSYTFNYAEMDRIPYMAPGLVGEAKAARGKTPTDVWWHTIVGTNSRERTGYVTQKPLGILTRIVKVHSNPGDLLLDFFAGSGSFGEAAALLGRDFILVDNNPQAIAIMAHRLREYGPELVNCDEALEHFETSDSTPWQARLMEAGESWQT